MRTRSWSGLGTKDSLLETLMPEFTHLSRLRLHLVSRRSDVCEWCKMLDRMQELPFRSEDYDLLEKMLRGFEAPCCSIHTV